MKTNFTTLLLIVVFTNPFFSQNVGFLGKKNSFDLGVIVAPSFTNYKLNYPSTVKDSSNNNVVTNFHGVSVHLYPEINFSRTLSRNWDISVRLNYQTFKLYFAPLKMDKKYLHLTGYNGYLEGTFYKKKLTEISQSILTEINFRYNFKKHISPIGPYINFGFGIYSSRVKTDEILTGEVANLNYNYNTFKYETIVLEEMTLNNDWLRMGRINLGFHAKRILSNYLYFDGGIDFSVIIYSFEDYTLNYRKIFSNSIKQKYISNTLYRYSLFENIATIKLSIGYLF